MFDQQQFINSIYNIKDLPKDNLPEVILCGRSNVGKSSFINAIFNRKDLAKTSSTPGKTRSINYYLIDDKFYIVDLPGYGYAKTSKKEREFWSKLIGEFIATSKNINLAFHFIDSRHKPTELDVQLNKLLTESAVPYLIVLSKVDKLKQSELASSGKKVKEIFPEINLENNLVRFSAVKKTGKKEVLSLLSNFIK